MKSTRNLTRWYWSIAALALTGTIFGCNNGPLYAAAVTAVHALHFRVRSGRWVRLTAIVKLGERLSTFATASDAPVVS
jgi:hypothetical protein